MVMSDEEYQKRMKNLELQKESFEKKIKQRPPLYKRMWFWATCWRPITKLEAAHTAQAIVSNRQLVNSLVIHVNKQSLKMSEIIKTLNNINSNVSKEKETDKNDIMIQ